MHVSVAYTPSLPVISAAFRFGSIVEILGALAKKGTKRTEMRNFINTA